MKDYFAKIGNRLLIKRTLKGLSLADLSKELEVSPSTLSRIENGKSPSGITLKKVTDWLDDNPSPTFPANDNPSQKYSIESQPLYPETFIDG